MVELGDWTAPYGLAYGTIFCIMGLTFGWNMSTMMKNNEANGIPKSLGVFFGEMVEKNPQLHIGKHEKMNTDEEKIGAIISILTHIAKLQSVATLANGIMGLFLCTFVHLDIISGWASVIYLITNGTMMTSFAIVHIVQPSPQKSSTTPSSSCFYSVSPRLLSAVTRLRRTHKMKRMAYF